MHFIRFDKILELLIEISIGLVVFFIPLYFSDLFFPTFNNFELAKNIIFRFLILILLFLSLLSFLFKEKRLLALSKIANIKKNWKIFLGVFLVFFISSLSTIFSIDINSSFWGLYDRQLGLISIIYVSIFYFLVYINIASFAYLKRLLYILTTSSFFVCLYGLLQVLNLDFISWSETFLDYGRITSSLGQPNFLAFYLLFTIPITFYLLINLKNLFLRYLFSSLLALEIFILIFTHSLSGLIGFLFGILVYLIFLIKLKKIPKINIKILSLLIPFLIIIFIIFSGSFIYKAKISGLINLSSGNIVTRLSYYKTAVKPIIKKPFLGYGLETQDNIFLNDYQETWSIYNNINSWPNRAHNFFIDLFLTSGILGIFAYLFLFYAIIESVLKLIKHNKYKDLSVVIFVSLVAHVVALQFLFEFSVGFIFFYLFLALLSVLLFLSEEKQEIVIEDKKSKKILFVGFLFVPFIILILVFAFVREKNLLLADYYYWGINKAYHENAHLSMFDFKDKIDDLVLPNNLYDYKFSQLLFYSQSILNNPSYEKEIKQEFLEVFKKNNKQNYFSERLAKANALYILAGIDDSYKIQAINEFKKINEEIINLPLTYFSLAKAYLLNRDLENALISFQKGIKILPDLQDERLNVQHRELLFKEYFKYYFEVGEIYVQKKEYKLAEHYYRLALRSDLENYTVLYKIANTYFLRKDYKKAENIYLRGYEKNLNNYIWSYMLARVYKENGDYSLAKKYISVASDLYGENPQVQNLKYEIEDILKNEDIKEDKK